MPLPSCPRNGGPPKRSYESERAARNAAKEQFRGRGRHCKRMRVYHCDKCAFWHLTSLR